MQFEHFATQCDAIIFCFVGMCGALHEVKWKNLAFSVKFSLIAQTHKNYHRMYLFNANNRNIKLEMHDDFDESNKQSTNDCNTILIWKKCFTMKELNLVQQFKQNKQNIPTRNQNKNRNR